MDKTVHPDRSEFQFPNPTIFNPHFFIVDPASGLVPFFSPSYPLTFSPSSFSIPLTPQGPFSILPACHGSFWTHASRTSSWRILENETRHRVEHPPSPGSVVSGRLHLLHGKGIPRLRLRRKGGRGPHPRHRRDLRLSLQDRHPGPDAGDPIAPAAATTSRRTSPALRRPRDAVLQHHGQRLPRG